MTFVSETPQTGQASVVQLAGIDINVVPGSYQVSRADRFGQKISTGDLRYQDFNPFESAESISNLTAGAGLLRMSDKALPPNSSSSGISHMYKETSGVNASGYPTCLAPQQNLETVTGSTTPIVWAGEFTPSTGALAGVAQYVLISGTKVWRRTGGSWTDTGLTLAATARKGAIGVFLGSLIVGYGSAATAQATTDLATLGAVQQTAGPTNIYIFALTTDRAASYIAGGSASTFSNQIMSSTAAASGYAGAVQTGDGEIVSLAPGGGIAIVFVGKKRELGEVDTAGVYRVLLPFDAQTADTCKELKWWLGAGGEAQRGPLVLVFPRERGVWLYQPESTSGGQAFNLSPWASPVVRPPNARGAIGAIQGTTRWLYFTTTSTAGRTFVWRRDAATGASHTYLDMGSNACSVLGVTSLFGTNPLLFVGTGNNITSIVLPVDGDYETDDTNCRFTSSGTLSYADIDLGFPDEDKVAFAVRAVADDVVAGAQEIRFEYAVDNSAFVSLGSMTVSPAQPLSFGTSVKGKRLAIRAVFTTNDPAKTPKLLAISVRVSLNTFLYRVWEFTGTLNVGESLEFLADNLQNPKQSLATLWAALSDGFPIQFKDRWADPYAVRLLDLIETETLRRPDLTPETQIKCTLLYVSAGLSGILYDSDTAVYDSVTTLYS